MKNFLLILFLSVVSLINTQAQTVDDCVCFCCNCIMAFEVDSNCDVNYSSSGTDCAATNWEVKADGVVIFSGSGAATGSFPLSTSVIQYEFKLIGGDCDKMAFIDVPQLPTAQPLYSACDYPGGNLPSCPTAQTGCNFNLSSLFNVTTSNYINWAWTQSPGNPGVLTSGGTGNQIVSFDNTDPTGTYTFSFEVTFGNACVISQDYQIEFVPNDDHKDVDLCQDKGLKNLFTETGLSSVTYTATQELSCSQSSATFNSFDTDNLSVGTYVWKLTKSSPNNLPGCSNCELFVTVELREEKFAGTPTEVILVCSDDAPAVAYDLFITTLNEDTGGTWLNGTYDINCNLVATTGATAPITGNEANLTTNGCAKFQFAYYHENLGCDESCMNNDVYYAEIPTGLSLTAQNGSSPFCVGASTDLIDLGFTDICSLPIGVANQTVDGFYLDIVWTIPTNITQISDLQMQIDPQTVGTFTLSALIEVRNDNTTFNSNYCESDQVDFVFVVQDCCPPATTITYDAASSPCDDISFVSSSHTGGGVWSIASITTSPSGGTTSGITINTSSGQLSGLNTVDNAGFNQARTVTVNVEYLLNGCTETGTKIYDTCPFDAGEYLYQFNQMVCSGTSNAIEGILQGPCGGLSLGAYTLELVNPSGTFTFTAGSVVTNAVCNSTNPVYGLGGPPTGIDTNVHPTTNYVNIWINGVGGTLLATTPNFADNCP